MTITDYQKQINRINRIKQIKKAAARVLFVAALVAIVAGLGFERGRRMGRLDGQFEALDAVSECTNQGATGFLIGDGGFECIFD